MEIPGLVRTRLGDESVETAVNLGDEDVVCFTPTRTLLYRGDGLLSDEGVETYSHDVERLTLSQGRRKSTFKLEYVDGVESFSVPADRTSAVLERLVDGVLGAAGVMDSGESLAGVFRFSELTLVVTSARMVKHIGNAVWDGDYEEYPFEDVTNLSFEPGSVATSLVLTVDGRPQRIKAPNDQAPKVRDTLEQALFAYYEVDSLEELNREIAAEEADEEAAARQDSDIDIGGGISPLVGEDDEDEDDGAATATADDSPSRAVSEPTETDESDTAAVDTVATDPEPSGTDSGESATSESVDGVDPAEIEAMQEQLVTLTKVVERQSERIDEQQETIEKLIEELRQGR